MSKRLLSVMVILSICLAFATTAEEHTHSWGAWETILQPSCEGTGLKRRECSCGAHQDETIPAKGHSWTNWVVTQVATCTAAGSKERTCSVCSKKETEAIAKLSHTMSEWQMSKAPTCTVAGEETRRCTSCGGQVETREIPAKGHKWGDWYLHKAATCLEDGQNRRVCLNGCGIAPQEQVVPKLGHSWGPWIEEIAPTCTTDGSRNRSCVRCGAKDTAQVVPKLGHSWGPWIEEVTPTCTTDGSRNRSCVRCAAKDTAQTVPKLGHLYGNKVVITAPTCVTKGQAEEVCVRCGDKKTSDIPATGKDSTLGHNMGDWVQVTPASCTAEGQEKRTCANGCGRAEVRKIPKLPHVSDGVWVVVRPGDLRHMTKLQTKCTVCGQPVETAFEVPKGYRYEVPTYAFGLTAQEISPALAAVSGRLIYVDLMQDSVALFPLVTEDGYNIGTAEVTVSGGSICVSLKKLSEPTIMRYRFWKAFSDPSSIRAGDTDLKGAPLPFDQFVSPGGKNCLIVIGTIANYYQGNENKVFNENLESYDGVRSYREYNEDMRKKMEEDYNML